MGNTKFTYSVKICKSPKGIRLCNICKNCNVLNSIKRERCIKCFSKIK